MNENEVSTLIKIYLSVNSNSMDECTKKIENLKTKINNIFNK